jgi:hypothetical protein
MCRDGHVQIGHNDSEHELCPLCRCRSALAAISEAVALAEERTAKDGFDHGTSHVAQEVALAVTEERERCAKVFERWASTIMHGDEKHRQWLLEEALKCASAIRSQGQT